MSDTYTTMGLYRMSNPVFECYAFYSVVLILKMIVMSFLTVFQRMKKNVRVLVNEYQVFFLTFNKIISMDIIESIVSAQYNTLQHVLLVHT